MKRLIALVVAGLLGILVLPALARGPTPGPPDSFEIAPGVTADNAVFVEGEPTPSLYHLRDATQPKRRDRLYGGR
jgi:hypothetical protein